MSVFMCVSPDTEGVRDWRNDDMIAKNFLRGDYL